MRVWIWIAILVMGCSKTKDKQEPITLKKLGDVLVLRIPGPNGQATFVRADAISVCPTGKPPCRIQGIECPDCTTPICDCRRAGCQRMCDPRFWPDGDALQFLKDLGPDNPRPTPDLGSGHMPTPAGSDSGSAGSGSASGSGSGG